MVVKGIACSWHTATLRGLPGGISATLRHQSPLHATDKLAPCFPRVPANLMWCPKALGSWMHPAQRFIHSYSQSKRIQNKVEKSLSEAKEYVEERKKHPQPLQVTCGNWTTTPMLSKGKASGTCICTGTVLASGIWTLSFLNECSYWLYWNAEVVPSLSWWAEIMSIIYNEMGTYIHTHTCKGRNSLCQWK